MKVAALAGGTGSAKLLRGLAKLSVDLTAVVNVGDNAWMYGVYVCPDIDIATYALAGVADREKGWGIGGDTFSVVERLSQLGEEAWFRLGDLDLATCLVRTSMLRGGASLTEATDRIRRMYGVKPRVLPATDSEVETRLVTSKGDLHLQEFWVRERGRPRVSKVRYEGARRASATSQVRFAILGADRVVVCPGNPVTSLGPMLAIPGFESLLARAAGRVVALSPMAGEGPFSGPAGKLMGAMGLREDSVGVARLYSKFLDAILISDRDSKSAEIESLGVKCREADTFMEGPDDEVRLAKEMLDL